MKHRQAKKEITPEAVERLHRRIDDKDDWRGVCITCGAKLQGTVTQLLQHEHEEIPG